MAFTNNQDDMKEFLSFVHDFKNGRSLFGLNTSDPTKIWDFCYKGMEMKSHEYMPIDNYKISMYGFNMVDRKNLVRFMKFNYNEMSFKGDDFEKPFEKILQHYEGDDDHIVTEEWILGIHRDEIVPYYKDKVYRYINQFKKLIKSNADMVDYYEKQLTDIDNSI